MAFRDVEDSQIKHKVQLGMTCHPWRTNKHTAQVLYHLLKEAGACLFDTSTGDMETQESQVRGGMNENGLYRLIYLIA